MSQPPLAHLASPAVTAPSPQHLEQIAAARVKWKKIRRCASTATFSAWTMAIFGALTVLFSIRDPVGLALGVGMCVMSHFEFRGASGVRRLSVTAPMHLARNQLIFGSLLAI